MFKNLFKIVVVCLLVLVYTKVGSEQLRSSYSIENHSLNERITNDLSAVRQSSYIDKEVNGFLSKWGLKGASVALIKDEKLVYAKGFGQATKAGDSVEPGNLFRVASVSKLITAVGIMNLVEAGKLSLDDTVFGPNAILNNPIFNKVTDRRLYDITVRQLLSHTGGWSKWVGDPAFNSLQITEWQGETAPATISTFYRYVASRRLSYYPGTRYSYSNMGYMFLADIIEKVSGEPYASYIQQNILEPNGIYDMHIGSSFQKDRRPNEVNYFEQVGQKVLCYDGSGRFVNKSDGGNPIELLAGAGGWICSSVELAKLVSLIDGDPRKPDILSPKSIEEMAAYDPYKRPLGWRSSYPNGDLIRTGSMAGTIAMIKKMKNGYTWIFLSNSSNWKGNKLERNINYLMTKILHRVNNWPTHNLFNYYKVTNASISYIDNEIDTFS